MIAATRHPLRRAEPAYLTRIRLRAQRRTLWLRSLWGQSATEPAQGLAISHDEVDRILAGPSEMQRAEVAFYDMDPAARELAPYILGADAESAQDPAWERLMRDFGLSLEETDLLALAVAVETDPLLRRVYAYLHDDATATYPTPWLAACLFQWPSVVTFGPGSSLVRWRMARPREGLANPWSATAPWAPDPAIVSWIVGGQGDDPALGDAITTYPVDGAAGKTCLYPQPLNAMRAFIQAMWNETRLPAAPSSPPMPLEIELIGPEGVGKRTLAAQLCAELGAGTLVADAGLLLAGEVPVSLAVDHAIHAARAARLSGSILYWHNVDGVDPRVWTLAQGYTDLAFFGTTMPIGPQKRRGMAHKGFRMPVLSRAHRLALWSLLSTLPAPLPIREWSLTPAEIVAATRVAPAGEEAVVEACREALHQAPGELFTPLDCPYTWDDIVLTAGVRQHLAELEAQARLRAAVYEEWGFERLVALGRGVTALFAGPSGTGKTMAAQVLARALEMELYRVDLAGVVNKYIGETEKRLKLVFDACERANVLLFFDEADALFGQRTQVKDAHDRFANIEIDYLLQRMEQFDGIAILATNRKGDMDAAFMRRIRFIVDFLPPGPAERLRLWRLALLERSPQGDELLDEIDWEFLANKLTMTGAQIKAAALGAAFLARTAGTRITMQHILRAAHREFGKAGVVLRAGDWED